MTEVWVVAAGCCCPEQLRRMSSGDESIICADRGTEVVVRAGLRPHLLVGDFDSLSAETVTGMRKAGVRVLEFPVKKDASDVELALEQALLLRPQVLTLYGGWGSRWDHSLSNVHLLAGLSRQHPTMDIHMVDSRNRLTFVRRRYDWHSRVGSPVSLLPYSSRVEGVTTRGLYYPLANATLTRESTLGISNCLCEERASIRVESGLLMLINSYDDVL